MALKIKVGNPALTEASWVSAGIFEDKLGRAGPFWNIMRAPFIWKKGFTLVELVGAVVIIGILVGIVAISAGTSRQRTLDTRVKADIEAINAAKGLWSLDHNGGGATFNNLSDPDGKFDALKTYLSTERSYSNIQEAECQISRSRRCDWSEVPTAAVVWPKP